jgi:preprotein translocase subunit SecE
MALSVYKSGQGYYTRTLTAIGAGTLVIASVVWLWAQVDRAALAHAMYWKGGIAAVLVGGLGWLVWHLINKPRTADFMIATEAEMKKVNWPTRREIVGSTWIVICGVFLMAALLFVVDIAFGWFFLEIGILEAGAREGLASPE